MYENLKDTVAPWVIESAFDENYFLNLDDIEIKNNLFILNGDKMKDWKSLFKEFQQIMKFPDYCGNNKDAFDECMMDLHEWLPSSVFIIFIKNSDKLLIEEDNYLNEYEELIESFNEYAQEYSEELFFDENNVNNRKKYPFHVILGK
jgi:RNAse (barnase) inhibitor barstar